MNKNREELDELYQYEYNRRFPKKDNSFVYNLAEEMANNKGDEGSNRNIGDFIGEGLIQGLGQGINKEENNRRKTEMEDVSKITGDILMNTQKLKQQLLENQSNTATNVNIVKSLVPNIRQYAEAKYNGDLASLDEIGRGIFEKLSANGLATGNYISTKDGNIIGQDENGLDSLNLDDLLASSGLNNQQLFGEDGDRIRSMLSIGAKNNYDENQKMSQAKLDELYGKNQKNYYEGELKRKEFENYLSPETENLNNLNDSLKLQKAKDNEDFIRKDILPELTGKKKLLSAIIKVHNITTENPNLTGSGLQHKVRRALQQALGLNPNIDLLKLNSLEFEKTLKPILGAQLAEQEGLRVLLKNLSEVNHIDAIKTYSEVQIPKLTNEINSSLDIIKQYEKTPYANLFVDYGQKSEQLDLEKTNLQSKKIYLVKSPDGITKKVPENLLDLAIANGGELIE